MRKNLLQRLTLPALSLSLAIGSMACSSSPKEPDAQAPQAEPGAQPAPTPPAGMTDAASGKATVKKVRKWSCSVRAKDQEFKGSGTSQLEARQLAMQACTKQNDVKACQDIRCK